MKRKRIKLAELLNEPHVHAGNVLDAYLAYHGLTRRELARRIGVSEARLSRVGSGERRITSDLAVRLGRCIPGTTPLFWIELQARHDIGVMERSGVYDRLESLPFGMPSPLIDKAHKRLSEQETESLGDAAA